MARIDKTESAIGMQRVEAGWAADAATGELDNVRGVGIDSTGKAVVGAGNTGIVGLSVRSKIFRRAGDLAEIISLGEIVEIENLAAGTKYYCDSDGELTADADAGDGDPGNASATPPVFPTAATPHTYVGYTIEADRLVVRL